MAVRSDVIAHGTFSALATSADILTVGAGQVVLLKDLAIWQQGLNNAGVQLQVVRGGVATPVFAQTIAVNSLVVDKDRFIVMEAGDILRVFKELTSTVLYHLSGATLIIQ